MQMISLFNEPLLATELNLDNQKILNYLKKVKYINTAKTEKNGALCQMSERIDLLKDLPLLKKEINTKVKFFIENILEYNIKFKLLNSWSTQVKPNGFSQAHHHTHSLISGVYYPIGDEGFRIEFTKKYINKFFELPIKNFNPFNSNAASIGIKSNMLILFLSDLGHEILPNKSNIDRYSLAFNVNPIGKIGTRDSEIDFKS
jgi:uncharacterized protein (TIGR02466 family)